MNKEEFIEKLILKADDPLLAGFLDVSIETMQDYVECGVIEEEVSDRYDEVPNETIQVFTRELEGICHE